MDGRPREFSKSVNMSYYKNKIAYVVGGSEGIGLELAKGLLDRGAHVVILSRSEEKLQKAVLELQPMATGQQKLSYAVADVTNYRELHTVIEKLVNDFGCPQIVLNTAGIALTGYIDDSPTSDFETMFKINVMGQVHLSKVLLPHFKNQGHGHLMNTGSILSFFGLWGYSAYCTSKFAALGFNESLKRELKPYKITVSMLFPPTTDTPGLKKENETKPKEVWGMESKSKCLSPVAVADYTLKQLPRKKFFIIPTLEGRFIRFLNVIFPRISDLILKRKIK